MKTKLQIRKQKYYLKNRNEILNSQKNYYINNKKKIITRQLKYYEENKLSISQKQAKYYLKIKFKRPLYAKNYKKQRSKVDIGFKLSGNLRNRIWMALNGNIKSDTTLLLLGCSINFLKKHLESQFTNGMSWENYGRGWNGNKEWHIDHIIPCASFNLTKKSEQKKCFHYTNLQPLWSKDNRIKHAKKNLTTTP